MLSDVMVPLDVRPGLVVVISDRSEDTGPYTTALAEAGHPGRLLPTHLGPEAVAELARLGAAPAVVFLDMPAGAEASAAAVLARVRGDRSSRLVPVVVVSSSAESADVATCYAGGANAYLVKSSDVEGLTGTLRSAARFWAEQNVRPPTSPLS